MWEAAPSVVPGPDHACPPLSPGTHPHRPHASLVLTAVRPPARSQASRAEVCAVRARPVRSCDGASTPSGSPAVCAAAIGSGHRGA